MKLAKFRNQEGRIYTISEAGIRELAENLSKKHDVYGPVNTHDEAVFSKFRFKIIEQGDKLELHYPITTIPPTKYFFPSRETILEFGSETHTPTHPHTHKPIVIFGISLFDLKAINRLDKIFGEPIQDEIYGANRKRAILISISEDFDPKDLAFDIHFRKIGQNKYIAWVGSKSGQKIIDQSSILCTKTKDIKKKYKPSKKYSRSERAEIIAGAKDDPIWDKLAKICFGCGICSYVCPMCYCFDTEDVVKIEGITKCQGCRERRWDSCMNADFAAISSHDFRPELKDRIYNWYHHKFVRMPAEHGFSGCVGCKRCITYCPAKINFRETLEYLEKKYG